MLMLDVSFGPITRWIGECQHFKNLPGLYAERVGRDADGIAGEVVTHLVNLVGSPVRATPEIEAQIRNGIPDNVVRFLTEDSRTLKLSAKDSKRIRGGQ